MALHPFRSMPCWSRGVVLGLSFTALSAQALLAQSATGHSFAVQQDHFALDGKPFRIISGEIHYPRVPRAEWRQRLKMARAMGLNTITTYVFWNVHETKSGVYDFSGQNDVAEFIREAQQEGLYVILRPGPYVCAEWEWGGYPAWLLKEHGIVVRSSDPKFMTPVATWMKRLGEELAPLQIGNGGPIIAVQVENEYGSFGDDHAYMEQVHHLVEASGFTKSLLYTADGPAEVPKGSLPELPAVINFGGGGAEKGFATLHEMRPNGPFMTGEYWAGWFDHWGEKHHTTDPEKEGSELDWILGKGYSASIYMFHGGTSFGWMNGANFTKGEYQPDTTSYDYDAPLSESGQPTAKFYKFREVIAKETGITPPPVPPAPVLQTIAAFPLPESRLLWSDLPRPVRSDELKSMEDLDQAYGYLLYRTTVPSDVQGALVLDGLHDYVRIYADGVLVGSLDRRLKQDRLTVTLKKGARLDLLVENSGRVNYTTEMRGERKGILGSVQLAGTALHGWEIYSLPMQETGTLRYAKTAGAGPTFYRGSFETISSNDTYLDTRAFHKGFVWVNGHPLGRVWKVGPQQALFLPGSWLKQGKNDVVVFDLDGGATAQMSGLDHPVFGTEATGESK